MIQKGTAIRCHQLGEETSAGFGMEGTLLCVVEVPTKQKGLLTFYFMVCLGPVVCH